MHKTQRPRVPDYENSTVQVKDAGRNSKRSSVSRRISRTLTDEFGGYLGRASQNGRTVLGDIGNLVNEHNNVNCKESVGSNSSSWVGFAKRYLVPLPLDRHETSALERHGWGTKQKRTAKLQDVHGNPKPSPAACVPEDRVPSSVASATSTSAFLWQSRDLQNREARRVLQKNWQAFTSMLTEASTPLPDIDIADRENPLAVVDYVEDIYSFYRRTEAPVSDYMSRQADLNDKMRAILLDWIIEVHDMFKLMPETLFLTINLIDRFLSRHTILRKNLQLVGITAMLLAAKYEELSAPEVRDFTTVCDDAYTPEQVFAMEKKMLNTLGFNLTVPTPYVFLKRFLKAATSNEDLDLVALFLLELSLVEYCMIKYPPSMLAAAAVYTAQCTLHRLPRWSNLLQHHSGYSEGELMDCATKMVYLHKKAGQRQLTVHSKYSCSKQNGVSLLPPATLTGQ